MERSSYKESAGGPNHGDYAAAQSRNVASLSQEIAEAIFALSK
jgi:hypothetical protein